MRKPSIHNTKEKGQAILLIAVMMVALIAMLGLAIDGGGIFLMYRDVQNATDAAGLSAAYAMCTGGDAREAAIYSADLNGFTDGLDNARVTIENPPTTDIEPGSIYESDENYVQIIIADEKPSYFIRIVYTQPLIVSASTIAYCDPGDDFGFPENSALVTLNRDCEAHESVRFRGSSFTGVFGNVFVNQDAVGCDSVAVKGGADVRVTDTVCTLGSINYTGSQSIKNQHGDPGEVYSDNPGDTECAYDPVTTDDPLNLSGLDPEAEAVCGPRNITIDPSTGLPVPDPLTTIDGGHFVPGHYSEIDLKSTDTANLAPGVYCVHGDISIKGNFIADDVFIYQTCSSFVNTDDCDYTVSASGAVTWNAPDSGDYQGLALYSKSTSITSGNDITAASHVVVEGTFYTPQGDCEVNGGTNVTVLAQFICNKIDLGGDSEMIIQYEPATTYSRPASFGVSE